ncbi:MAG: tRNA dihydrouridine(20/20a) synthase DusA [Pseudomonadota bacterium]
MHNDWYLALAPMMQRTDRHFRLLMRLISKRVFLFTEMIPLGAIVHGDAEHFLKFDPREHPIAVQIGGSDAEKLAQASLTASEFGYDEINLNCGCPSDRVQSGNFGACLMRSPDLVADCIRAMRETAAVPVTIKMRLGVDELDHYDWVANFVATTHQAGCKTFHVHARKAWLKGLNPKQNREIPPLHYDWVYRLRDEFPRCRFTLNGGLNSESAIQTHRHELPGVMIGRWLYNEPYDAAQFDQRFFGDTAAPPSRLEVLDQYLAHIHEEVSRGTPIHRLTKHLLNFFARRPGAKRWRRLLTETTLPNSARLQDVAKAYQLAQQISATDELSTDELPSAL